METTSNDNFYLLLELFLDPPEEEWAKVEARINEKKEEWNKKRNCQGLSERVEDMRKTLNDAEERKAQGWAARREKLLQLDEQIKRRSGETIAPEQVDALVQEFSPFFHEATVRSRVKVPICAAAPPRRRPVPPTILQPLEVDLSCEYKDGKIEVSWSEPRDGSEVFLWVTPKPSRLRIGQVRRVSLQVLIDHLGAEPEPIQDAELTSSGRRLIRLTAKRGRQAHYILLATKNSGGYFTICAEKTVYSPQPAPNFYAQYMSHDVVYFNWDWPNNAEKVVIYENSSEPPREENYRSCKRYVLTKAEYQKEKAWRRGVSGELRYYRIFMVYKFGEREVWAPGLNFRSRRSFVEYKQTDDGDLVFTTDDPDCYIPEICVVRHWGRPPYRRNDGEAVLTIPASRGEKSKRFAWPKEYYAEEASADKPPYYRCYFKNYDDTLSFALLDPPYAQLKWPTSYKATGDRREQTAEQKAENSEANSKETKPGKKSWWSRGIRSKSR